MFDKASKCCPSCKEDFPRNPGGRCQKTKIKNSIPEKSSQLITYLPHQTVVMVNYTESPILSPFARWSSDRSSQGHAWLGPAYIQRKISSSNGTIALPESWWPYIFQRHVCKKGLHSCKFPEVMGSSIYIWLGEFDNSSDELRNPGLWTWVMCPGWIYIKPLETVKNALRALTGHKTQWSLALFKRTKIK